MNSLKSQFGSLKWLISFSALAILLGGCETTDYEPLIFKDKMRELEQRVSEMEEELATLKTNPPAANADSGAATNVSAGAVKTGDTTENKVTAPKLSLKEEKAVSDELEKLGAKSKLDSGRIVEVNFLGSEYTNDDLAKLADLESLLSLIHI